MKYTILFTSSYQHFQMRLDARLGTCTLPNLNQFRSQNKYMRYFLDGPTDSPIFCGKSVFGRNARLPIHPTYMQRERRAEAIANRERDGKEEERVHISTKCIKCVQHPGFIALPSLRERERESHHNARTRLLLSHFYSLGTLFLDYGLSAAPFVIAYFYSRPPRP